MTTQTKPTDPFEIAGLSPDEANPCEIAGLSPEQAPSAKVTPYRVRPADRLPVRAVFGAPPLASLYHTARAEGARQRGLELGTELAEARQVLFDAGVRRVHEDYADVADHNTLTLAYALRYARAGLHVVDSYAIDPRTGRGMSMSGEAKIPLGAGWQKRASTDPAAITAFWTGQGEYPANSKGKAWPYKRANYPRNVSIVLPEGCGLFVLDEDGDEGLAAVRALEAEHGPLPRTPDSRSGSGNGRHRIFRASRTIRNTASQVAPGVDIRGEGGQIIAAPSIHKSGNFYQWSEGCAPWQCDIADAPEWLENLAFDAMKTTAAKVKRERREGGKVYASGGLGFEGNLALIGDGDDHEGFDGPIYRAACSWWSANPDGDEEELFDTLREVIRSAPCADDRAETRYASDEYLAGRIAQARAFIEERRVADDATELARATLREHLTDEETPLDEAAIAHAIACLTERGLSEDDARECVDEAASDVMRQLEERAADRARDPVKEERREEVRPSLLAPLYDDRLVTENGFMIQPGDAPRLYREFKIDPKADNAESLMRAEIRDQITQNLRNRVSCESACEIDPLRWVMSE